MRMTRAGLAAGLFMLLAVAGCAHAPRTPCLSPVASLRYCLLPPGALPADAAPRLINVSKADTSLHMISQLMVRDNAATLSAVTLLGQPLFELHYTEHGLRLSPSNAPVDAAWLVALLQITFAEPAAVNAALTGATLAVESDGRQLRRGGDVLLTVAIRNEVTTINIPAQSTTVRIERLETGVAQ